MRVPATKRGRTAAAVVAARLNARVMLEVQADGSLAARFDGYAVGLGQYSAEAMARLRDLRSGLPLASFASRGKVNREIELLVQRLAERGLLEYRLARAGSSKDLVVIEPQIPDYWPQTPKLGDSETVVLSRFAYLRRRGNDMVLESPRAGALFRICDPKVAAAVATLSAPHRIGELRRQAGFPGTEWLGLLLDCKMLFKVGAKGGDGRRAERGRRKSGDVGFSRSAVPHPQHRRPPSQSAGRALSLRRHDRAAAGGAGALAGQDHRSQSIFARARRAESAFVKLQGERHSLRDFDDQHPITLAELARFLENTARVQLKWNSKLEFDDDWPRCRLYHAALSCCRQRL